jgi:hypothetical protein
MMQKLRKKTRLVLFIALAAFALLIFFQWGLNIMGVRTSEVTNIAVINGIPISVRDYSRFAQFKENEKRGITREEIWAELVDEIMWGNLISKEKIVVTDEEIWTIIRNNPPQDLYESEYMRDENGEFDINKYYEFLRAPQSRQWLAEYESKLRQQLPKEKLRALLTTFGWVSPFEVSMLISSQTMSYDVSFISIPIFGLRSLLQISDDEMEEYYNENLSKFIKPESKILKYVFLEKKASYDDTLEAKERMEDFLIRIKEEGEDFLEVAWEVSDDTILEINFQNENELFPYLKKVYKNLKNGEISDIIDAPRGFEVIKRVQKGTIYKAKANIEISPTTIGEINDIIMSFKEAAQEVGFDSAAVEFDLPVRKTYPLNPKDVAFPVRNTKTLSDFLSKTKKDEIGGPFSSMGGYYLFTIDSIIPEYEPKFEEIMPRVRADLERKRLKEELEIYLNNINNQLMMGETMDQVASRDTLTMVRNDLKNVTLTQIISRFGEEFAGAVAYLEPTQISPPLITDWAGYIIRCDKKIAIPFDSTMVFPLQMKRQTRLQQLTQSIFTPKEMEDNRDIFLE